MSSFKAPKGGITSEVNGQWYNGGEFTPDTGLYCGRGKNRVTAARFAEVAAHMTKLGYSLRYSDKHEHFEATRTVRFADVATTDQIFFTARNLSTFAKLSP